MLKLKRIKAIVKALEESRNVLIEGIDTKKVTKQELKSIKDNKKNFVLKALPDYNKLLVYYEQKDPDTNEYVYKETFRKEVVAIGAKLNELKDEVDVIDNEIIKGEEIIAERQLKLQKEKLNQEQQQLELKKKAEIEYKRQNEAVKEAKRLKEERELSLLKAEIAEKTYSKNKLNRIYNGLKARVDIFLETVREKTKTASLDEELNVAVGLFPAKTANREQLLKLLIRFYNNITKYPDKEEYRCFNLENEKFKKEVLSFSGSLEILVCGGFELLFSEVFNEETSEIVKSIELKLEEPDVQNYDAWKNWFDTQKAVLEKLKNIA